MSLLWEVGRSLGVDGSKWAMGCETCDFGLVWPEGQPALPKTNLSLSTLRTLQASRGELTYCDCRAGQTRRRQYLGDRAEPNPVWRPQPEEQAG